MKLFESFLRKPQYTCAAAVITTFVMVFELNATVWERWKPGSHLTMELKLHLANLNMAGSVSQQTSLYATQYVFRHLSAWVMFPAFGVWCSLCMVADTFFCKVMSSLNITGSMHAACKLQLQGLRVWSGSYQYNNVSLPF